VFGDENLDWREHADREAITLNDVQSLFGGSNVGQGSGSDFAHTKIGSCSEQDAKNDQGGADREDTVTNDCSRPRRPRATWPSGIARMAPLGTPSSVV